MRGNKYNFIYDDTPEKRKFVDNWCKLGLETGNVVTIGKDSNDAYLIGYSEDSIIHHREYEAVDVHYGLTYASADTIEKLGVILADKLRNPELPTSFDKFKSVEEYVVAQTMELISH